MTPTSPQEKAEQLHLEGMALSDDGREDVALQKYLQALALDPHRFTTAYNIGLIYKYRNQWADSFRYNQRAVALEPEEEAANWNLAIAATALRDWRTARSVWKSLGMPIEMGDQPIEADFGMTPVRLNPDENAEVVWGKRIDPVRVQILNVPTPASGFRYADVVLHDGAAVGKRMSGGREYPVFNVLELFESSPFRTYEAEVVATGVEDIEALQSMFDQIEDPFPFENWTTSLRYLCKQCSEGVPHEHHDKENKKPGDDGRYLIGLAVTDDAIIRQTIKKWEGRGRKLKRLECVLR